MKKNISRNPLWPDWYNGKKIDEVQFGRAFLEQWPLKCVNGTLYTLDGPVEDESEIKQRILENIEEYVTSGLSKKVTNILETIKLLAFSDPFPIEQDCIHLQNGVYHLPDGSFQESRLFCQNRLPVRYDPKAASPDRWLTFLHELLDDADIPTLQEYLGYCLIPLTEEMENCIPDAVHERQMEAKELGKLLDLFLESLPKDSRLIFLRRYWYVDSVPEIAARYGMTESKVKMQLSRTKEKLRLFLEQEGIYV